MMNFCNNELSKKYETTNHHVTKVCTADYLKNLFAQECEEFQKSSNIRSGYANLDKITQIYPGLYVIGAISSLGKTTFIYQMCDQMARNSETVLYFSFEQSRLELTTKSLARTMAETIGVDKAMSAIEIRENHHDDRVGEAIVAYAKTASNTHIVDCSFFANFNDIEDVVMTSINEGKKPIVVVDYLQVIQSSNSRMTTKESIDEIVKQLKQLQKKYNLVVMVISSINRQNYLSPIDFDSFKETGGIEYTADVVWGLDFLTMYAENYPTLKPETMKKEVIKVAKRENPRKIRLTNLKNRFGEVGYICDFNYYPHRDMFVPVVDGKEIIPTYEDEELPFF